MIGNSSSGFYKFRGDLIRKLIRENHEVIVLTPLQNSSENLIKLGVKAINVEMNRRGKNPLDDVLLYMKYKKILLNENPDFVLTYTIKPNLYGGMICKKMQIPYAANITGLGSAFEKAGLLRTLVIDMYKLALGKAKYVFFENSENMDLFVSKGIVRQNKTVLLNGAGVNTSEYKYLPYPCSDRPFRFLFMGRIMKEKGVDELFEAMEKLVNEGYDCNLSILGTLEEGYGEIIKKYDRKGWLKFYGRQENVKPYIEACHCGVLPSYHEGMSNTNLECAASGRPIITSNIAGCREAVINGISGLLCEAKNSISLYLAMKAMIEMNNQRRKDMGKFARQYMEQYFDKTKVVDKTIEYILK